MNAIGFAAALVQALGWGLVQFVWQAVLVAAVYALVRAVVPRGNARYLAAMLALVVLAACPVVTVWRLLAADATPAVLGDMLVNAAVSTSPVTGMPAGSWRAALAAALPWIVLAWMLGVGVLGVRVFRQWRSLRAMLQHAQALPAWQARAQRFAGRLGLQRVVPVLASVRVATPTLVGWLRPAVVLPLAVLAHMPAAQIDLILAHELAHLKRCDHIANLFQVVLETLFFYHPVVHWISRDARNERELCCDALALRATGGARRDFVAALASLEELRAGNVELALAASGGVLVERAWFIAGAPVPRHHRSLRGPAVAGVVAVALLGLGGSWWQHATAQRHDAEIILANAAAAWRLAPPQVAPVRLTWVPDMALGTPRPLPMAQVAMPEADVAPVVSGEREPVTLTVAALPLRLAPLALAAAAPPVQPTAATRDRAPVVADNAAPRPLRTVRPEYPSAALLAGAEARIVVEFALDTQGVPYGLKVEGPTTGALVEAFASAAQRALQQWRFAPPAAPGRRYRQMFTFQIGSAPTADPAATARACVIGTGTHICRQVSSAGVAVLPPSR